MIFEYNDRAKKEVAKRISAMNARINNQIRSRDAFESRSKDPEALYFCGFEMSPDFVKLGDEVFTKYGDDGKVVVIYHETGELTIKAEDGELITLFSDRISSLEYGDVQYEEESTYFEDQYGWE